MMWPFWEVKGFLCLMVDSIISAPPPPHTHTHKLEIRENIVTRLAIATSAFTNLRF